MHHIQREAVIASPAACERHHPVAMTPVQRLKRPDITVVDGGDEVMITPRFFVRWLQLDEADRALVRKPAIGLVMEQEKRFRATHFFCGDNGQSSFASEWSTTR